AEAEQVNEGRRAKCRARARREPPPLGQVVTVAGEIRVGGAEVRIALAARVQLNRMLADPPEVSEAPDGSVARAIRRREPGILQLLVQPLYAEGNIVLRRHPEFVVPDGLAAARVGR